MEEREVVSGDGVTTKITNQSLDELMRSPTADEVEQFVGVAASIASRSITQTALVIPNLPNSIYAEWIPHTQVHIAEAMSQGFIFPPRELITFSPIHDDGSDKLIHGDVVLMVMPRWKKEKHDEQLQKRIDRNNRLASEMIEEREFLANAQRVNKEAGHNKVTVENYSTASKTAVPRPK